MANYVGAMRLPLFGQRSLPRPFSFGTMSKSSSGMGGVTKTAGREKWLKLGGFLICGSPLLFTNWEEKNPSSEIVFLTGKSVGGMVEKFLENEYGQSIFLVILFAASGMFMYNSMKIRRFVFDLKHKYAASSVCLGHPAYFKHHIPRNPLIKP